MKDGKFFTRNASGYMTTAKRNYMFVVLKTGRSAWADVAGESPEAFAARAARGGRRGGPGLPPTGPMDDAASSATHVPAVDPSPPLDARRGRDRWRGRRRAAEAFTEIGQLRAWNNKSGHYWPDPDAAGATPFVLSKFSPWDGY